MAAEVLVNYMYTVVIRNVMVLLEIIICAFFVEKEAAVSLSLISVDSFCTESKATGTKIPLLTISGGMNATYAILFTECSTQAKSSKIN